MPHCLDQPACQRHVSFNLEITVYEYKCSERNPMFYSYFEIQSMKQELELHRILYEANHNHAPSSQNPEQYCLRGLENFVDPEYMMHKRKHKLKAKLTVLMEQDRQFSELGFFTPSDDHSISYNYHQACFESRLEACQRAMHYAKEEQYWKSIGTARSKAKKQSPFHKLSSRHKISPCTNSPKLRFNRAKFLPPIHSV